MQARPRAQRCVIRAPAPELRGREQHDRRGRVAGRRARHPRNVGHQAGRQEHDFLPAHQRPTHRRLRPARLTMSGTRSSGSVFGTAPRTLSPNPVIRVSVRRAAGRSNAGHRAHVGSNKIRTESDRPAQSRPIAVAGLRKAVLPPNVGDGVAFLQDFRLKYILRHGSSPQCEKGRQASNHFEVA